MQARLPLSTLLSHALIAYTIELDNEFERRFEEGGGGARVTSLVMWSNLLRFVGDGIAVGDLVDAVGLQKPRVLSPIGGVERWRYVYLTATSGGGPSTVKRDAYGSSRGIKGDWTVRLTPTGERAAAIWRELHRELADRWRVRFGVSEMDELESALREVTATADRELPEYLPIVASANGMALDLPYREARGAQGELPLSALLSGALLLFTVDFEADSALSLTLSANVVRVLDESGTLARDLPALAGTSKEAIASALTFLRKMEYVRVDGSTASTKTVRLTSAGRELRDARDDLHADVEERWTARIGGARVARVRAALEAVLDQPDLVEGLRPHPGGWRASAPYAARTEAMLADPRAALPQHPLVLYRGGWPDGS